MRFFHSIKIRLLIVSITLAIVPAVVNTLILGSQASSDAAEAIESQVGNQLISLREIKKVQLEEYLHSMELAVSRYSIDPTIVSYMQRFTTYYIGSSRQLGDVSGQTESLIEFYDGPYAEHYRSLNIDAPTSGADMVAQFKPITIALQYSYLAANDAPFGEKHNMNDPEDGTSYSPVHNEGHRQLKRIYEQLGVEELYLIDPNGNIVYSVHKNPDFATNLIDGPYKDSVLAELYTQTIKTEDSAYVGISDVQTYSGVFNEPAIYIASPIQDLEEEDAFEILGVMVLKIPLSQLNTIMSSNAKWQNVGMGKTGDAYIVGADNTLRTNVRELIENKEAFITKIQHNADNIQSSKIINIQNTAIARYKINTDVISTARNGEPGIIVSQHASGTEFISAYTPIKFKDLNWIIISEIETNEAFASSEALSSSISKTGLLLTLVIAVLAVIISTLFATVLTKPIIKISKSMSEIERTADLTHSIDVQTQGELAVLVDAVNRMLKKFKNSMNKVAGSTIMVSTASEELSSITQGTYESVNQQFQEMDQTATAINQMSATVQGVAESASEAAKSAQEANAQAISGKQVVESTIDSISDLSHELNRVSDVINNLNKESESIGAVMDVIKGIAEQTNLLALNAAIEAARAGEQGRGFAVVADEVRTLASRTQQSTVEIESMVEKLQHGARDAVTAMQASQEKSQQSVQNAASAGDSLVTITTSIDKISEMNISIANAAKEQSTVTEEISKNIVAIRTLGEKTTAGAEQTSTSSDELSRLSTELQILVSEFKTE